MSATKRREIARKAAFTRWAVEGKDPPAVATYGAADRPLRIGPVEMPCYVLADSRRVFTQRGLLMGLGLSDGGGRDGERKLTGLVLSLEKSGIDIHDLAVRANSPIRFMLPHGGKPADGYEATILPDLCAVIIKAGVQGLLHARVQHITERCALLQHGFATVGIIALVDEATGFDRVRPRDALAKILEAFVAKELRPWVRTFEPEFYEQIFRLNGWQYAENCARPAVLGHWTNNIVYRRLAPGVLAELKARTPKTDAGNPKNRLHQWLTKDLGHPKLREHLAAVTMLMKYSPNWKVFMFRLDKELPQYGATYMLPFPDDYQAPDDNEMADAN